MGLFDKFKNKSEKQTWIVYQDMLGDKKMSVRVDTKYQNQNYKNTFYVQVKYCDKEITELPNKKFLEELNILEETVLDSITKTFENNIVFLRTATFGGSSYITFASNLDVMWEEYVKSMIDENLLSGVYPNDNMGYYNQILYPDFIENNQSKLKSFTI